MTKQPGKKSRASEVMSASEQNGLDHHAEPA